MTTQRCIVSFLVVLVAPACFSPTDPEIGTGSMDTTSSEDVSQTSASSSTDDGSDVASTSDETSGGDSTDGASSSPGTSPTSTTDASTTTEDVSTTDDATTTTDATTTSDATTTDATESTDAETSTDTGIEPETRIVFATSVPTLGAIGPVAHDICQSAADDAGLDGTFLAWISLGNASPSSTFTQFDGEYVRTDGVVIAEGWDDLVDGDLLAAINHDENGDVIVGGQPVWTNTDGDGTAIVAGNGIANCTTFTSMNGGQTAHVGRTAATTLDWTDDQVQSCALAARLYCFEQ